MMTRAALFAAAVLTLAPIAAGAQDHVVALRMVDDRKAVIATVEPMHQLTARAMNILALYILLNLAPHCYVGSGL
jgi:hypothetical protein